MSNKYSANKLMGLECIRGAAALYVFLGHFVIGYGLHVNPKSLLGIALSFGQEAVIVFFLLSGFVIHYATSTKFEKNYKFGDYFKARFIRIYPILFVVYFLSYVTAALKSGSLVDPDYPSLLGNMLMLQDFSTAKPNTIVDPYLGNGPLWSLSYEWWFYMAYFPLASKFKHKTNNYLVAIISVTGVIAYIFIPNQIARIMMYFAIWWSGVHLCEQYVRSSLNIKSYLYPLATLMVCAIGLAVNIYVHKSSITTLGMYPILELRHFAAAIIILTVTYFWSLSNWMFFGKIFYSFRYIAPFSYALYVIHVPIIEMPVFSFVTSQYGIRYFAMIATVFLFALFLEKNYQQAVRGLVYKYRK